MANLTVIGLYFSLETVIFAFYGKFPIRMRMSPYSTNDVRMDFFLGFVSEMESRLHKMYAYFLREGGRYINIQTPLDSHWTHNNIPFSFVNTFIVMFHFLRQNVNCPFRWLMINRVQIPQNYAQLPSITSFLISLNWLCTCIWSLC